MDIDLEGKVQTVLGTIEPEDLGITLYHEHLLTSLAAWYEEHKADYRTAEQANWLTHFQGF